MIDVSPTAAISVGASVPLAALGLEIVEPGTGMRGVRVGPTLGVDLGVLIAQHVLPHVRFERAWVSCELHGSDCSATNDVAALGVRVTSSGRFRVFGDLGIGLRRLTTDPTPARQQELQRLYWAGYTENRADAGDASRDITWSGVDSLRVAVGTAYRIRDELAVELELLCAFGSFRHVRTSEPVASTLDPSQPRGLSADLREDRREPYVIFGLSLAARGFLP